MTGVDQMDSVLLLMGRRRRMLRAEVLIVFLVIFVFLSVSQGLSLGDAVAGLGFWTAVLIVGSGLAFSAWESRESRRRVGRFRDALIDDEPGRNFSTVDALPICWPRRVLPTAVCLFVALPTYFGSVMLYIAFAGSFDVARGLTSLALVFLVYGVSLGAGYAISRWWLLLLVLSLSVLHFLTVPVLPHASSVPDFVAQPGNGIILVDATAALWVWYLLRPRRMRRQSINRA